MKTSSDLLSNKSNLDGQRIKIKLVQISARQFGKGFSHTRLIRSGVNTPQLRFQDSSSKMSGKSGGVCRVLIL